MCKDRMCLRICLFYNKPGWVVNTWTDRVNELLNQYFENKLYSTSAIHKLSWAIAAIACVHICEKKLPIGIAYQTCICGEFSIRSVFVLCERKREKNYHIIQPARCMRQRECGNHPFSSCKIKWSWSRRERHTFWL